MNTAAHGYVLFCGTLVQQSAMVVGGEPMSGAADHTFARDGQGRLTLNGKGLAGALLATARKVVATIPHWISGEIPQDQRDQSKRKFASSAWRTFTSHPCAASVVTPEMRIHVAIRADTGAKAEHKLFDQEVIARGVRWPFLLEVAAKHCSKKAEYQTAVRIAQSALQEWQAGRLWLGLGVAGGLGWLKLEDLHAYELDESHATLWPNSSLDGDLQTRIEFIERTFAAQKKDLAIEIPAANAWCYQSYELALSVGPADDGYGHEGLHVGGFASPAAPYDILRDHLLQPEGMDDDAFQDTFTPDHIFVTSKSLDGTTDEPFIPGSSLRGPLRHALARLLRSQGQRIFDPSSDESFGSGNAADPFDVVADLFGEVRKVSATQATKARTNTRSSRILISDAVCTDANWRAAWLQHHAEDEFSQSTFGGAKYDRVVLLRGAFKARIVIEAKDDNELQKFVALIDKIRPQLQAGLVPIGGNTRGGLGWLQWTLKEPSGDAI
jgi:CRISPR/Cas system CSM-associated protein Csm3 (group 7 of RAMP superfamily)